MSNITFTGHTTFTFIKKYYRKTIYVMDLQKYTLSASSTKAVQQIDRSSAKIFQGSKLKT